MNRFYSPSTGCTYLDSLHAIMPEDAVPIDDARYDAVIANPAPGKIRSHDEQGLPILNDPAVVVPSPAELADYERTWRDTEVTSTEWLVNRHRDQQDMQLATTLSGGQFAELLSYRQVLRDWPQSPDFPQMEFRPIVPSWIKDQVQ